jgi:hypothetical protein
MIRFRCPDYAIHAMRNPSHDRPIRCETVDRGLPNTGVEGLPPGYEAPLILSDLA